MFNWIKRHFYPHKGNNFRPHFLHGQNARKFVLLILVLELLVFVAPITFLRTEFGRTIMSAVLPAALNDLTNEKRQIYSLNTLNINTKLAYAAELKAKDMALKGYFAHTSPEGFAPWYWLGQANYSYEMAGENLAINFVDSKDVTEAWMNSPTHRDNIVRQGFTEIGTGIASGMYQGSMTTFVVQYYAKPKVNKIATVSKPTVSKVSPEPKNELIAEETPRERVLGELETQESNPVKVAISSPKNTMNAIILVAISIVALALFINFSLRVNRKHPDLVTNGLAVAAIVFAIYLTNNFFLNSEPLLVSDSEIFSENSF